MLPVLDRELAQKKKWVTGDDLLDYYAVSQVTPGVIAVNVSTFVGARKAGVAGGVAATAGVVSPSIIIITVIALFISSFEKIVWVQKVLAGVNVAVTALLSYAGFNFAKKSVKNWWGLLIYACSFCAVFFYKIPSVAVVLLALAVGLGIHFVCAACSAKGALGSAKGAGGLANNAGGSAKRAGGSAEEAGGSAKEAGGLAKDAGGSGKEALGSAKESLGSAEETGGSAKGALGFTKAAPATTEDAPASTKEADGSGKDAGGSAKGAGGSAKDAPASTEESVGSTEESVASTETASKTKSKNKGFLCSPELLA